MIADGDRIANDDEVLAMVLYTGMHLDKAMADEAARRVGELWGRPVDVITLGPAVEPGGPLYVLLDSDIGAPPSKAAR